MCMIIVIAPLEKRLCYPTQCQTGQARNRNGGCFQNCSSARRGALIGYVPGWAPIDTTPTYDFACIVHRVTASRVQLYSAVSLYGAPTLTRQRLLAWPAGLNRPLADILIADLTGAWIMVINRLLASLPAWLLSQMNLCQGCLLHTSEGICLWSLYQTMLAESA
jgi:hypothetical protein